MERFWTSHLQRGQKENATENNLNRTIFSFAFDLLSPHIFLCKRMNFYDPRSIFRFSRCLFFYKQSIARVRVCMYDLRKLSRNLKTPNVFISINIHPFLHNVQYFCVQNMSFAEPFVTDKCVLSFFPKKSRAQFISANNSFAKAFVAKSIEKTSEFVRIK